MFIRNFSENIAVADFIHGGVTFSRGKSYPDKVLRYAYDKYIDECSRAYEEKKQTNITRRNESTFGTLTPWGWLP